MRMKTAYQIIEKWGTKDFSCIDFFGENPCRKISYTMHEKITLPVAHMLP